MSDPSNPEQEVVKTVEVSEEDFVNTLAQVRKKQESAEQMELQALAGRLSAIQKKLDQTREKIRREKAFHEVLLLEKVIGSSLSMFSVEDMDVKAQAKGLCTKSMTLIEQVLDREFPTGDSSSK